MPKPSSVTIEKGTLFTSRGFLLLILTIYLIGIPVREHNDIFAAVVGFSLASWLTLIGITIGVVGYIASRKSAVSIITNAETYSSQIPVTLFIHNSKIWTPPFSTVSFEIYFDKSNFIATSEEQVIKYQDKQTIALNCTFPHRGVWIISCIRVILKDSFGITSVAWQFLSSDLGAIRVAPKIDVAPVQLPVIASQITQGDDQIHMNNRLGDNFDIKPYHASDGMRKIVWKVFAKSGQLVSRHPEPTFTPEGKIAIFVLAKKQDDATCRAALNYVKELEEQDYDICLGCSGSISQKMASNSVEAEELLITTVWDAEESLLGQSLDNFLRALRPEENSGSLLNCAVFLSSKQLNSEENLNHLLGLFENCTTQGVSPVFFFLEEGMSSVAMNSTLRIFLTPESNDDQLPKTELRERFYKSCLDNNWEVLTRNIA